VFEITNYLNILTYNINEFYMEGKMEGKEAFSKTFKMLSVAFLLVALLFSLPDVFAKDTDNQELINQLKAARQKLQVRNQMLKVNQFQLKEKSQQNLSQLKHQSQFHVKMNSAIQRISEKRHFMNVQKSRRERSKLSPLFKVTQETLNLLADGVTADTVEVGTAPILTWTFPTGETQATLEVIVDFNKNGIFDSGIDTTIFSVDLEDNDIYDSDPTAGFYQLDMSAIGEKDASFINIIWDFIVAVSSGTEEEMVSISFQNLSTIYSVSGTVTDESSNPLPYIVIIVEDAEATSGTEGPPAPGVSWITLTESDGTYRVNVPDEGYYNIMAFDHLGIYPGLYPDPFLYENQSVMGDEVGFDFTMVQGNCTLSGVVQDDNGNPIPVAEIYVSSKDGPIHIDLITDDQGNFSINLMEGAYWIGVDPLSLEGYLVPPGQEIYISEGETVDLELILYPTDETISGTVYLDDNPIEGARVFCWHDTYGITADETDENGNYTLNVKSGPEGYHLHLELDFENFYVEEQYDNIPAGSEGIDFHAYTVNGGLFGYVIDSETSDTLMDVWISAERMDDGKWFYSGIDWETRQYMMYLPDGNYILHAGAPGYDDYTDSSITISGEMIQHDIFLEPKTLPLVQGVVTDTAGNPIPDALVVFDGPWHQETMTDENGEYNLWTEPGSYVFKVFAEKHYPYIEYDVWVPEMGLIKDASLTPLTQFSIIAGQVKDESDNPVSSIMVNIFRTSPAEFYYHKETDDNGEFNFHVPNGTYVLDIWSDFQYLPVHIDTIDVQGDSIWLDILLREPAGAVQGIVFDSYTNRPIKWAWVDVYNVDTDEWFYGGTDDSGRYYIPLPNGNFEITAGAYGFIPSEPIDFTISDNTVEINIGLEAALRLPKILAVRDIPHDQGRWVRIVFWGGLDWDEMPFEGWSVWRIQTFKPIDQLGDPYAYKWDFVTYIPFHGDTVYRLDAHTLIDSNAYTDDTGEYWSTFVVSGHTQYGMWDFYDSRPEAGYSVDNIVPSVPGNVTASTSVEGISVSWEAIPDEDFGYYEVYKSTTQGSYTSEPAFKTIETNVIDSDIEVGNTYYYTVVAVDANGNKSAPSAEVSLTYTAIAEEGKIPEKFALYQNFPNPFNPTTNIKFDLPEAGFVQLSIYDINGRLIKNIASSNYNPGTYKVIWDATDSNGLKVPSGIYIYRINVRGKFTSSGKMLLMK